MILIPAQRVKRRATDVRVIAGNAFTPGNHLHGDEVELEPIATEAESIDVLDLAHDFAANYGHWLHDMLPQLLVLRAFQRLPRAITLDKNSFHAPHVRQWCKLLGVERVIESDGCGSRRLKYPLALTSLVHPEGLRLLRDFIPLARNRYPVAHRPVLLVQRSQYSAAPSSSRNLECREELVDKLTELEVPVEVVYLEGTPILQQIALFNAARLVVGVHGTALSNVVFCQEDCAVIEVRSPLFWNCTYAEIGAYRGLDYTLVHGLERHGNANLYSHCVWVPPGALATLIAEKAGQSVRVA